MATTLNANLNVLESPLNYKQPGKIVFWDALMLANPGSDLIPEMLVIHKPEVSEEPGYNTMVLLKAGLDTGWTGEIPVYYNRGNIATIFERSNVGIFPPAGTNKLSQIIAMINDRFGLWLLEEDYEDASFLANTDPTVARTVKLKIKPDSYLWYGEVELRLGNWKTDDVVTRFKNLDILHARKGDTQWVRTYNYGMENTPNTYGSDTVVTYMDPTHMYASDLGILLKGNFSYKEGTVNRNSSMVLLREEKVIHVVELMTNFLSSKNYTTASGFNTFLGQECLLVWCMLTTGKALIVKFIDDGAGNLIADKFMTSGNTSTVFEAIYGGDQMEKIVGIMQQTTTDNTTTVTLYKPDLTAMGKSFTMKPKVITVNPRKPVCRATLVKNILLLDWRQKDYVESMPAFLINGVDHFADTSTYDGVAVPVACFGMAYTDISQATLTFTPIKHDYISAANVGISKEIDTPLMVFENGIWGMASVRNPAYLKNRISMRQVRLTVNNELKLRRMEEYPLHSEDVSLEHVVFLAADILVNETILRLGWAVAGLGIGYRWRNLTKQEPNELVFTAWDINGKALMSRVSNNAGYAPGDVVCLKWQPTTL